MFIRGRGAAVRVGSAVAVIDNDIGDRHVRCTLLYVRSTGFTITLFLPIGFAIAHLSHMDLPPQPHARRRRRPAHAARSHGIHYPPGPAQRSAPRAQVGQTRLRRTVFSPISAQPQATRARDLDIGRAARRVVLREGELLFDHTHLAGLVPMLVPC